VTSLSNDRWNECRAVERETTLKYFATSILRGLFAALLCLAPLHAQTAPNAPASNNAPVAQAPDDMTAKITTLVNAGKYAEAQQLTTGLLVAYPDDQRLIKTKALLEKMLAAPAAPIATPANQQWAASASPALTGEDKLDYTALIELARQSQQTTDPDDQPKLLKQFMEQSAEFLKRHPEQMLLWQLRAAAAIGMSQPMAGFEAGQKLLASGAMDSNDSGLQQLLAKLKLMGWMDSEKVRGLQLQADEARRQQAEAAERDRQNADRAQNTFPAAHADGFHYGYGHITIDDSGAVYVGSDQTIHMAKTEMREVKAACFSYVCGLYFTPKSGRKYFIVAVTEDAVSSRQMPANAVRPPAVLGNAVVAKWKFAASADNKMLLPAGRK
jgi:hypothetical protein